MVMVGFCRPQVTNPAASTTKRFLMSWLRFQRSSTLVLGWSPAPLARSSWFCEFRYSRWMTDMLQVSTTSFINARSGFRSARGARRRCCRRWTIRRSSRGGSVVRLDARVEGAAAANRAGVKNRGVVWTSAAEIEGVAARACIKRRGLTFMTMKLLCQTGAARLERKRSCLISVYRTPEAVI